MSTYTPQELSDKLAAHKKWLRFEDGGVRANLTGADLTRANLTDADLTGAVLTRANLTGAVLTRAVLTDANLTGAVLTRANLTDANLTRANLTRADLTRAVGIVSWYTTVKADLFAVLDTAVAEVPALLTALEQGRVDGSTYSGECACLVGTLGHARGVDPEGLPTRDIAEEGQLSRDSSAPAEVWFMGIRRGDTPSTSPTCAITAVWVREWMAQREAA